MKILIKTSIPFFHLSETVFLTQKKRIHNGIYIAYHIEL